MKSLGEINYHMVGNGAILTDELGPFPTMKVLNSAFTINIHALFSNS